jgi:hypothetical protein
MNHMRTWIIGAAALLAVAAAPGVASAASGYVGVIYNNTDVDNGGSDNAWGAEGSVVFSGSSQISFELDGSIVDGDNIDTVSSAAAHLFTRNDSWLFGGFVGLSHADDSDTWSAGLEANKYFEQWTLAGALIYANNDDADANLWGVNAQARLFPTDNLRLQGNVGWARVDFGGPGGDDDAWTAGVGAEYQFEAMPVSIGANYNHVEFNDADVSANVWTVSLRYNFGGGSLRDRDRNGASQADLVNFGSLFAF